MRVVCVDYNAPNEFLTMIAVFENSRMRKEQLKRGDSVLGVAIGTVLGVNTMLSAKKWLVLCI